MTVDPAAPFWFRVLVVIAAVFLGHIVLIGLRKLTENLMKPSGKSKGDWVRRYPKVITTLTLINSSLTFIIYFGAIGYILVEVGVPVTAYVASASVIGLAVGFGSQGLVQDVVVGMTLIFSDVLDVGDLIDAGGQTGRVHRVGLRFTVLKNASNQIIYIANRNISQIHRYPHNELRVYFDLEVPETGEGPQLVRELSSLAQGLRHQYPAIVLSEPRLSDPRSVGSGEWDYLRIRFAVWPGQQALIETTFKNRVLEKLRQYDSDYPDWKLTVTSRSSA